MDALNGIASSIRITKDSCHFAQYYSRVSHGVHLGGPQMYSICIEVHDDYVPQPTAASMGSVPMQSRYCHKNWVGLKAGTGNEEMRNEEIEK